MKREPARAQRRFSPHTDIKPLYKTLGWLNIAVQLMFPAAAAFTPVVTARADDTAQTTARTRPYVLGHGETVSTVALRFNLSVSDLKKLNQLRTFSRPFEQLRAGDEIDVPVLSAVDGKPAAANLTGIPAADKAQTEDVSRWLSGSATSLAQATTGKHHAQVSDAAVSQARSAAVSGSEAAVSQWLSQFGTARIQLGVDDHLALKDSALDMLVPLYDNGSDVFFTQFGGRRQDDRTTLNAGTGVRLFRGHWMYGVNTFLDNDITGHNRRVGIGGEAWTDYLKLSANSYLGLTDWHQSRDFKDYDERPADGFDVAASAWLPAYPQLGGTLKYEQYQGDHVGLMGKDTLQKNPKAVTVGLNWTPVPLVTLGADYRNSAGHDEEQMQVQFSWNFGQSLTDQLSADKVGQSRTLAGSRLDLVERNNNIVLDYRKQELVKLSLPAETRGQAGSQVPLNVEVTAKYGVDRIDWQAPEFFAVGGKIISTGPQSQLVLLPATRAAGNRYPVHAVARDTRGNLSRTASGEIVVERASVDVSRSRVTLSSGSVIADGKSTVLVTLTVLDTLGNPVSGLAPVITLPLSFTPLTTAMLTPPTLGGRVWDMLTGAVTSAAAAIPVALANGGVTIGGFKETGTAGVYTATLTVGMQPGSVRLTPVVSGTAFPAMDVQLLAAASQAETGSVVAPVNPLADGHPVQISVPVKDASGKPLRNTLVILIVDGREISAKTDKNGNVVTDLPGQTIPGHYDYVVGIKGDNTPETVGLDFIPAGGSAPVADKVVVDNTTPAPGDTLTGSYAYTDADNDAEGVSTFKWYRGNTEIPGATGKTYTVTAADLGQTLRFGVMPVAATGTPSTGTEAKSASTAAVGTTQAQRAASVVVANSALSVSPASIAADNSTEATVTFTAKDAQNRPVTGMSEVTVGFIATTTLTSAQYSVTGFSESNGVYTVKVKGSAAGTISLNVASALGMTAKTVTLTATAAQQQAALVASVSAADSAFTISPASIAADGTATATLSFTAKNSSKAPVSGLSAVTFPETGVAGTTVSAVTESNGVYTATLSGTTPGVAHLTVSVSGTDKTPAGTHDVTLTATQAQRAASVVVANSALSVSPASIAADNSTEATVTFTAKDAQNRPVTGMSEVTVGFIATTTLTSAQYSVTGFSESNGVYTVKVKGTTPGTLNMNVASAFGMTTKTVTLIWSAISDIQCSRLGTKINCTSPAPIARPVNLVTSKQVSPGSSNYGGDVEHKINMGTKVNESWDDGTWAGRTVRIVIFDDQLKTVEKRIELIP